MEQPEEELNGVQTKNEENILGKPGHGQGGRKCAGRTRAGGWPRKRSNCHCRPVSGFSEVEQAERLEEDWEVVHTEEEEDPWAGLGMDEAEESLPGGPAWACGHAEGIAMPGAAKGTARFRQGPACGKAFWTTARGGAEGAARKTVGRKAADLGYSRWRSEVQMKFWRF